MHPSDHEPNPSTGDPTAPLPSREAEPSQPSTSPAWAGLPPTPDPVPAGGWSSATPPPEDGAGSTRRSRFAPGGPFAALLVAVAFVGGIAVGRIDGGVAGQPAGGATSSPTAAAGPVEGSVDELELIEEAWNLIQDKYVGSDQLDERELAWGAIDGMTEAVGDTGHTTFMTPEEREDRSEELSGSYVGIGVQVNESDTGQPLIVGVFRDSPAARAGLRPGDLITAVNGRDTAGEELDDVLSDIRGEAGTAVEITVRSGEDPDARERTVEIVRAEVEIVAVTWTMVPGTTTAFLRLEQFSNGSADEVVAALRAARSAGADRLVLDLRNNPGGYVNEAVGIASQFIGEGTVYIERNADGEEKATPVTPDGAWTDLPLVVLVDEGSASSAEILSGAIQDHERGTLVGQTTFGTGTVLGEFPLSDGSAMRIGTVEWLTPDGRRIWHQGITPDVVVERDAEALPTVPDDLRDVAPEAVASVADEQLARALEIVAGE